MSNEQQNNMHQGAGGSPYNPQVGQASDAQKSAIGNSVVKDLMRVYEQLTQSSTPQDAAAQSSHDPMTGMELHTQEAGYPAVQHGMPAAFQQFQPSHHNNQFPGMTQPFYPDQGYPPSYGAGAPQTDPQGFDDTESEEQSSTTGRARRKRRGSDTSSNVNSRTQKGGRKKAKATDGRWAKRFTWPEDLHRDFVSAIFDVGLKHSSPSTILEHMPKNDQITTERIKSHLQKYRLHRVKSKKEFVSSYELSLQNFQKQGINGVKSLSGATTAAHLSYTTLNEGVAGAAGKTTDSEKESAEPQSELVASNVNAKKENTDALMLPQLTQAEKNSPIGNAMGYLMGLFFSLKQELMKQRAMEAAEKKNRNAPVQDVYDSFVTGNVPDAAPMTGDVAEGSKDDSQSVRTNIEENTMMRREMQSQMALQTKMRALKQQELNKYNNLGGQPIQEKPMEDGDLAGLHDEEKAGEAAASQGQGAGETASNDNDGAAHDRKRSRGISIGAADEFWNSDVVDEQLFDFLMNN